MKLELLFEGMMKRSDPYISGEMDGPRPTGPTTTPAAKKSAHATRMANFAKKANVPVETVEKYWREAADQVDPRLANKWSLITTKVKQRLGLHESMLAELLNTEVEYEVAEETAENYEESAIIKGRKIVFQCEDTSDNGSEWTIAFMELLDQETGRGTVNATGSGGEMQVFSFIIAAVTRFVKKYKPKEFFFTATEPSRIKLYAALCKRLPHPGYNVTVTTGEYDTTWTFSR